jgi:hypothetical protein
MGNHRVGELSRQARDARPVGGRRHKMDAAAQPAQSFGDQRADAGDALDIGGAQFNLHIRT